MKRLHFLLVVVLAGLTTMAEAQQKVGVKNCDECLLDSCDLCPEAIARVLGSRDILFEMYPDAQKAEFTKERISGEGYKGWLYKYGDNLYLIGRGNTLGFGSVASFYLQNNSIINVKGL